LWQAGPLPRPARAPLPDNLRPKMATIETLSNFLEERDSIEQKLVPYFNAFTNASSRAVRAEQSESPAPVNTSSSASSDDETKSLHSKLDPELVSRLIQSRKNLEKRLNMLQNQLDQAQERARATAEIDYLKTNVVQGLHDEILALTMQLNLSEEKRKKLQNDLGR